MATTNQGIVERAMKLLGLLDPGESATTDELTECTYIIKNLLHEYQELYGVAANNNSIIVAVPTGSTSVTSSTLEANPISAFTYIDTAPTDISEVNILSNRNWNNKYDTLSTDSGTTIKDIYIAKDEDGGCNIFVAPKPSVDSSLKIIYATLFSQVDQTPSAVIAIRFEDERFLINGLAIEIAPIFGVEPAAQVYRTYDKLEKQLKRRYAKDIMLQNIKFPSIMNKRVSYNFLDG